MAVVKIQHLLVFISHVIFTSTSSATLTKSPQNEAIITEQRSRTADIVLLHASEYSKAVGALELQDYTKSLSHLLTALSYDRYHIDTIQLAGSVSLKIGHVTAGEEYLSEAINLSNWTEPSYIANYMEALRINGKTSQAIEVGTHGLNVHPESVELKYNLATIYTNNKDFIKAYSLYSEIIRLNPNHLEASRRGGSSAIDAGFIDEAIAFIKSTLEIFPEDANMLYNLGVAYHSRGDLNLALQYYEACYNANPHYHLVYGSIGAAYQGLGLSDKALMIYEYAISLSPQDAGIMNNMGALLGTMNRHEDSLYWLMKAYSVDPKMLHVLINLGSYFQDEADTNTAYSFFSSASQLHPKESTLLLLRMALTTAPVHSSWERMNIERNALRGNLSEFISRHLQPCLLDASLDRVPFYISYHGLNDRMLIEMLASAYKKSISNLVYINPSIANPSIRVNQRKIKVGFISKFFGVFEPHGLLLDGVMKYLPRSQFEVICLPVARSDGKPLAGSVKNAADVVIALPLSHRMVQELLGELNLDILVFADVMSEPMNHFLAHSRLAPIQVAFWGNPITSGSCHMDYFVSSDFMEHPFRTRMDVKDEPWTEQVVLLEGQGIWYGRPESPEEQLLQANFSIPKNQEIYNREYFGFDESWFIYLCPQSVFKMHPLFDTVFKDILNGNQRGHVVVTGGRRASWTKIYEERLRAILGSSLEDRIHVISRVSSEKFLGLIDIADVLLHPFPFDGSRTSADGLIVGKPVLTLPADHLRGRMGATFFRTMNIPELVAKNRSNYVAIAIELNANKSFYDRVTGKIHDFIHLIWEDMSVPFEWARFLSRAVGINPITWSEFIKQSGLDEEKENNKKSWRELNTLLFHKSFGSERWLLEHGTAALPSFLNDGEMPRIFSDWKSSASEADISFSHINFTLKAMAEYVSNGSYDTAAQLAYDNILICRNHLSCLLNLGTIEYFRGEYSTAYQICSGIVEVAPSDRAALSCKGLAALYLKKADDAIETLFRALNADDVKDVSAPNIFSIPDRVVQENILSALSSFDRIEECVNVASAIMDIPPVLVGGAVLIVFSFVDWHESRRHDIDKIGKPLFGNDKSLYADVRRIQSEHSNLLNHVINCYSKVTPPDLWNTIMHLLMNLLTSERRNHKEHEGFGPSKITLVTQYYESSNLKTLEDMQTALLKNLHNPFIGTVVVLTESNIDFEFIHDLTKLEQHIIGERLTFQAAFTFANRYLQNRTIVLANADIFFDESLMNIPDEFRRYTSTVLALSKWKMNGELLSLSLRTDSQDSWIFTTPVHEYVIGNSRFPLGAPRCDNRIAYLFQSAGYKLLNPAFAIRSVEIHSNARDSPLYSMKNSVRGTGSSIFVSDLSPM